MFNLQGLCGIKFSEPLLGPGTYSASYLATLLSPRLRMRVTLDSGFSLRFCLHDQEGGLLFCGVLSFQDHVNGAWGPSCHGGDRRYQGLKPS